MSYRLSWGPEKGFVSIVTDSARDALLLSAEYRAKGFTPVVSSMDGTPLTTLDLELIETMQVPKPDQLELRH